MMNSAGKMWVIEVSEIRRSTKFRDGRERVLVSLPTGREIWVFPDDLLPGIWVGRGNG
jgi:hypothetical protein